MAALPPELSGPVEVALARGQDRIPEPGELPGGCVYEPKWDGFRLVVVRGGERATLWSRRGTDLTARFPDIAAAAAELVPPVTVVDGEVVVWNGERLDFDLLSRRLVTGPAQIHKLAATWPASFVAFDLLARDGADQRTRPWTKRRAALEDLAARWRPPLQLTPVTSDVGQARAWFDDYRPAGVEGLVVKAATGRYVPGRTAWIKCKSRATHELILGGVLGPVHRPGVLVLGRYRGTRLVMLARSVPLNEHQARDLAALLQPAAGAHPWPELISGGRFGTPGEKVPLTRVKPVVVVEVSADTALHAGSFRHPVRYLRHRPDLHPTDVPSPGI
jgi:ATP-dependent DNA ligase